MAPLTAGKYGVRAAAARNGKACGGESTVAIRRGRGHLTASRVPPDDDIFSRQVSRPSDGDASTLSTRGRVERKAGRHGERRCGPGRAVRGEDLVCPRGYAGNRDVEGRQVTRAVRCFGADLWAARAV